MTQAPGLYEIGVGFYSDIAPNFCILVNDEPIGKRGGGSELPQHPSGNVAGYTQHDFISLPKRAFISVQYSGALASTGFLSLRKL